MRIKRVLQGTALTALAAAAWMGAGTVDASAAEGEFSINNVTGISTSGAINIKTEGTGYKEIMFGVASYNKGKQTVKIADNAWDVYEVEGKDSLSIDLSKLSLTKDNYIAIKSESTEPIYIKIGASVTSQKVKYTAGKLEIEFKKSGDGFTAPEATKFEYRTAYSSWNDFTYDKNKDIFTEYQSQGATLYVRAKASGSNSFSSNSEIKDTAGKSYTLYTGPFMPGKESKVNIKKMANGPSVSVDYVNGKVNIPANTEYRVIASGGAITVGNDGKPIPNTGKTSPTVEDLLKLTNTAATSGTIEVRKVATANKAASKWTRVAIEIPDKIVVNEGINDKHAITASGAATQNVADGITIIPQTKKGSYSGTIEVKAGTYDINVKIGATGKAVVVKAGGTKKISKATDVIYIGKAGNKKDKAWASGYVPVGKAE